MKRKAIGMAIVALAIGFNVPFARLAAKFEYPDILRRPVAEVYCVRPIARQASAAACTAGGAVKSGSPMFR